MVFSWPIFSFKPSKARGLVEKMKTQYFGGQKMKSHRSIKMTAQAQSKAAVKAAKAVKAVKGVIAVKAVEAAAKLKV